MGFKTGAHAKVWKFENKGKYSIVELSTSKKDVKTNQYETDFSEKFVRFIGKAHTDLQQLHDGDSIKLKDVEVTNSYNKETKKGYTNFLVFSFEEVTSNQSHSNAPSDTQPSFMEIPPTDKDALPFS
ncbi:MAG: hypothetical protein PHX08_08215 [Lachnospiraceae bacterium]|nr:hypothetical protein [Lachnospiraceae bacterium]